MPGMMQSDRYRAMRRITLAGSLVNFSVAVIQIAGGIFSHSQALLADGLETLSDLVSDAMVLFAARQGSRAADVEHPYGHRRIETVVSVVLGVILLAVAAAVAYRAGTRLLMPEQAVVPGVPALIFALVAILAKEGLYHATMRVARQVRSSMLRANAWHHRSDVFCSLIVFAGIAGSLAGVGALDALAALIVALFIVRLGSRLIRDGVNELIDTGLDAQRLQRLNAVIKGVDGVRSLHMLRTRRMGDDVIADVHIQVDAMLSVSEGHQIGEAVRAMMTGEFDDVTDVTIHVDPENDEDGSSCDGLPLRDELMRRFRSVWANADDLPEPRHVRLHYLRGRVHAELYLDERDLPPDADLAETADRLAALTQTVGDVGDVRVYLRGDTMAPVCAIR